LAGAEAPVYKIGSVVPRQLAALGVRSSPESLVEGSGIQMVVSR